MWDKTLSIWIDKFLEDGLNELVREKLENYFRHSHLQTSEQIQNTIQHIYTLV